MRCPPKTDILKPCLWAMVEKDPLSTLRKAKSDDSCHHGRLCFPTACSLGPETPRIQSRKKESWFTHGHLPSKSQ